MIVGIDFGQTKIVWLEDMAAPLFVGESDAPAKFGALLAMGTDGIVEVRRCWIFFEAKLPKSDGIWWGSLHTLGTGWVLWSKSRYVGASKYHSFNFLQAFKNRWIPSISQQKTETTTGTTGKTHGNFHGNFHGFPYFLVLFSEAWEDVSASRSLHWGRGGLRGSFFQHLGTRGDGLGHFLARLGALWMSTLFANGLVKNPLTDIYIYITGWWCWYIYIYI